MINIKNEGIQLTAIVRIAKPMEGEKRGYFKMTDNDYPDKESFRKDLRANGYVVRTIWDKRDEYIMDNSDYGLLSQVTNKINLYLKWKKDCESEGRKFIFQDELDKLIDLQKKALQIKL